MDKRMLLKVLLVVIATATSASEHIGAYGQETGGGNAGSPTKRGTKEDYRREPHYDTKRAERDFRLEQRVPEAGRDLRLEQRVPDATTRLKLSLAWPQTHIVAKGESLSTIARAAYGKENWQKIYAANKSKIKNPAVISIGQELVLPAP